MKSYVLHYKNKYPKGHVVSSENALDVYDKDGNYCVALRKNGAGQWVDCSEAEGAVDKHDLAPIPKDSRLYKEEPGSAKIIKDDKFAEREKKYPKFLDKEGRKIMSCEELKKMGFEFDEKQQLTREPAADAATAG